MPTITMKFNLPEEEEELSNAQHGVEYYLVIWETLQEIRKIIKYSEQEHHEEFIRGLEYVRAFVWEELTTRGVADKF